MAEHEDNFSRQFRQDIRPLREPPAGQAPRPTVESVSDESRPESSAADAIAIGLPNNTGLNGFTPPFIIGKAHTVFEWIMIYTEGHPAEVHPNHAGAGVDDMEMRLCLLGASEVQRDAYGKPMGPRNDPIWQIRNEIFRELEHGIEHHRVEPLRLAYCDDAKDVRDTTRCLISDQTIFAIARRRMDYGKTMGDLLARDDKGDAGRPPRRARKRDPDSDRNTRQKIEAVLAAYRRRANTKKGQVQSSARQLAKLIAGDLACQRPPIKFDPDTVRKILAGRYPPMERLGIPPPGTDTQSKL